MTTESVDPNHLQALLGAPFTCRLCGKTHEPTKESTQPCLDRFASNMPLSRAIPRQFPERYELTFEEQLYAAANHTARTAVYTRYERVRHLTFRYHPSDLAQREAQGRLRLRLQHWFRRVTPDRMKTVLDRLEDRYDLLLSGYRGRSRAITQAIATLCLYQPFCHPSFDHPDIFGDHFYLQFNIRWRVAPALDQWSPRWRRHYSAERAIQQVAAGLHGFIQKYSSPSRIRVPALNSVIQGRSGSRLLLQFPAPTTPDQLMKLARTAKTIQADILPTQRYLVSEAGWQAFFW